MAFSFAGRNFCAVTLAVIIAGLMIAAAAGAWYEDKEEFTTTQVGDGVASDTEQIHNKTQTWFDLTGHKTEVVTATSTKVTYDTYNADDNVKHIFKTVQAFVIIALVTAVLLVAILIAFFFDRIRNKVIFALGMSVTRILIFALAGLILVAVIVAFLVFLGITQAFKDDKTDCNVGPCRKFYDDDGGRAVVIDNGTTEGQAGRQERAWKPIEGWFLTLASIPVSLVLVIIVVINKFPLPLDSEASSGEAL